MARIVRTLPSLNRIVVLSKSQGHVWHDTTKDVEVTDITDATCPINSTPVQTGMANGLRIWFRPLQLENRVELEPGDIDEATLTDTLTAIDYDVPSHGETEGFSPVNDLRRYAVPMTKSVWLVRSGDVPWAFIAHMRSMGVKIDTSKLDISETRRKVCRAVMFMIDQVNEKIASKEATARAALNKLMQAEENEVDEETARKAYLKTAASITCDVKRFVETTLEGAKAFTLNPVSFGLHGLRDHATLIRKDMDARAKAYKQGVDLLATAKPELHAAAAADQLPVHAMSDALREAGHDKAADDINEVFDLV